MESRESALCGLVFDWRWVHLVWLSEAAGFGHVENTNRNNCWPQKRSRCLLWHRSVHDARRNGGFDLGRHLSAGFTSAWQSGDRAAALRRNTTSGHLTELDSKTRRFEAAYWTNVLAALERFGPQTGAELVEHTRLDVFRAWQEARSSPQIRFSAAGSRFLRLDRAVPGYARLSPSIRREFLTYTVLGLEGQLVQIEAKAGSLREEIRKISRAKRDLAREAMESVLESLHDASGALGQVCFIIAGDIAYEMSHTVPRPERSTGQMVRGSDLDIIVVAQDGMDRGALNALDGAIHKRKHFLLVHPEYREEIDYVVKDIARVRTQLRFDTFEVDGSLQNSLGRGSTSAVVAPRSMR